jgi:hypothetical protein
MPPLLVAGVANLFPFPRHPRLNRVLRFVSSSVRFLFTLAATEAA